MNQNVYEQIESLFKQRKFDAAIALSNQHLTAERDDAQALFWRGVCYLGKDESRLAINDFDRCVALDPTNVNAFQFRGEAFCALHEFDQGEADFTHVVTLSPMHDRAFHYRGKVRMVLGRPEEALEDFDQSLFLNPDSALVLEDRANCHRELNNLEAAIADLDRAIQLVPNNWELRTAKGDCHYELEQDDDAALEFEAALRLKPGDPRIRKKIADALLGIDERIGEVITICKGLVNCDDRAIQLEAWMTLGIVYNSESRWSEAIDAYEHALLCGGTLDSIRYGRVQSLIGLERYDLALPECDALEVENHPIGYAKVFRAQCYRGLGKTDRAIHELTMFLDKRPNSGAAFYERAICHQLLGHQEQAEQDYARAAAIAPDAFGHPKTDDEK